LDKQIRPWKHRFGRENIESFTPPCHRIEPTGLSQPEELIWIADELARNAAHAKE
jgi:hypothetical protein